MVRLLPTRLGTSISLPRMAMVNVMKAEMSAVAIKPAAIARYSKVFRTFFPTVLLPLDTSLLGVSERLVARCSSVEVVGVSETITQ